MPHNKALPTLRSLTIQVESFLVLVLDPFYTFVGANSFSARRLSQHLNMLRSSTPKCPPLSSPAALQHAKGPCRGTGGGCIASGSLSRGLPNGIEGSCPFRHLSFAEDRPPCRIANFCEAFLSQSEAPKRQSQWRFLPEACGPAHVVRATNCALPKEACAFCIYSQPKRTKLLWVQGFRV